MDEYFQSFNGLFFEMGIPARLKRDAQTIEDYYSFQNRFKGCNLYTSVYGMTEPANYKTAVVDRIFLEFDGEDKNFDDRLLADFRQFLEYLQRQTDIVPQVFFSGNSGFHVVIYFSPLSISNPHKAIQRLVENLKALSGVKYLDLNANNGLAQMRRIPNSQHQKTGLYAVPLSIEEVMFYTRDEIRHLAVSPRPWIGSSLSNDVPRALNLIDEKIEKYKLLEMLKPPVPVKEFNLENCKAFAAVQDGVPSGQRDMALVALVYALRSKGFSREESYSWLWEWHEKNNGTPQSGDDEWIRYKIDYHYKRPQIKPCIWFKKAGYSCEC